MLLGLTVPRSQVRSLHGPSHASLHEITRESRDRFTQLSREAVGHCRGAQIPRSHGAMLVQRPRGAERTSGAVAKSSDKTRARSTHGQQLRPRAARRRTKSTFKTTTSPAERAAFSTIRTPRAQVRGRSRSRDLQALSLVQMLVGKALPSAENFDPDELSFGIEVEDDLARRSSASTRRSILGVDR
jgi:hypothetical protein